MQGKVAIIVAGGSGSRMNTDIPKQFLLLRGVPLLMHTINRFYTYDNALEIRLVLPTSQVSRWKDLCSSYHFTVPHTIFSGGKTRFHSVKNGLKDIPDDLLVAVHDGVRPLVSKATIGRCFQLAGKKGSAIPVLELTESIRKMRGENSVAKERQHYRLVQTPQVFRSEWLKTAYHEAYKSSFTDDASVLEEHSFPIFLTEGNEENIKITTPYDLKIADILFDMV